MNKTIGFIGCGNMGEAILAGGLKANAFTADSVYVYTPDTENLNRIEAEYHIHACDSNMEVYKACDYVIFAIKPYQFEGVTSELKEYLEKDKIIVSIAAGITIKKLNDYFDASDLKIIRVMPNTPVLVNQGASGICASESVTADELSVIKHLFESVGVAEIVSEEDIHGVVAVSGSSPAYGFMFLDAMIKTGVKEGLSYSVAKKLAAQAMIGAATMVLESSVSPNQLKENVCSPNGTTLEAVKVFEEEKLEGIVEKAMVACANKSREMSK